MLLAGQVEREAVALAASLAAVSKDGWLVAEQMRSEFESSLIAEPAPLSDAERLKREMGL